MEYSIEYRNGHVEVLDVAGNFVCSADTVAEARQEIQNDFKEVA